VGEVELEKKEGGVLERLMVKVAFWNGVAFALSVLVDTVQVEPLDEIEEERRCTEVGAGVGGRGIFWGFADRGVLEGREGVFDAFEVGVSSSQVSKRADRADVGGV
jgi:hypothetical protein